MPWERIIQDIKGMPLKLFIFLGVVWIVVFNLLHFLRDRLSKKKLPPPEDLSRMEIVPKGMFSNEYDVLEKGARVAVINKRLLRESGELTIHGHPYTIRKESLLQIDSFLLEEDGQLVVRGKRSSFLSKEFKIEKDGSQYMFKKPIFQRSFVLRQGDRVLGIVYRNHWFSRRATAEVSEEIPLELRVFIFWLAVIVWRREAARQPVPTGG